MRTLTPPSPALVVTLAVTLAGALASHAQAPAPPSKPVSPAPVVPAPVEPVALDDPMLATVAPAKLQLASWAQMRDLVDVNATELKVSEARVHQAEGRFRQSLSSLLPNANLSAGIGYDILNPGSPVIVVAGVGGGLEDRSRTVPLGAAAVIVRQSVIDLRTWSALDAAGASTRGAEAAHENERRRVLQSLARAVVVVVTNERVAELSRVGLRQSLERAAMTQRLFELGVATHLDVVRVHQDVAVARTALIEGDERLRLSREDLGAVVGLDVETGVAPSFAVEGLVSSTREECEILPSVAERADVKAARAEAEAAAASRREAWTGYLPSLEVNSGAAAFTTDPGPGRFSTWTIAAVLSVPLWEGGFREGLVQERSGRAMEADATLAQVESDAAIEQQKVQHTERAASAVFASAKEAYALADQLDRLTRRSFEMGRATSLDLVLSGVVLRQAQVEVAVRESQWLQSRLDAFFTLARCPS